MKKISYFFLTALVAVLVISSAVRAQQQATTTPLEKLLNPDGTVNLTTGFSGSLDPKGFKMTTGPNGEPRFKLAAVPEDINWDGRFGSSATVDTNIYAIAISGDAIFIGGKFDSVGGTSVNHMAKWESGSWTPLGGGINGEVYAINASGGNVYVGGLFDTAGGIRANNIAMWDGSNWSAMGGGMNAGVLAIGVRSPWVIAGGWFDSADGRAVNGIAAWDGSLWNQMGNGVHGTVNAIGMTSTRVYVGGYFNLDDDQVGGTDLVAYWDGSWHSIAGNIGIPFDPVWIGYVKTLTVLPGDTVYVGGSFFADIGTFFQHDTVFNVAKWVSATGGWSKLGIGTNGSVNSIITSGGSVYIGGDFMTAGGSIANHVAKWNGSAWSAVGSGMDNSVNCLAVQGSDLYAGGWFSAAGGVNTGHLARWDGSSWSKLVGGLNNWIHTVAVSGSDVYIGGDFTTIGGVTYNRIAKWDGIGWSRLGSGGNYGVDNRVSTIAVHGTDVYVGGSFTSAGGVPASRIAKWDGASWSPLGIGVDNYVLTIATTPSGIYVGGGFTQAGGTNVHNIAYWNGSSWWTMAGGMNSDVRTIAISGTDVYAGGWFTTAGGVSANYIAKWDGTKWDSLGSGMNSGVHALAVNGTDVYVGGQFTVAGGLGANYLAKWNGSSWSSVGNGLNSSVFSLCTNQGNVYACGLFDTAGSIYANRIARWDGTNWSTMGSGLNDVPFGIGIVDNDVYVGGAFTTAGEKPSVYFAHWSPPLVPVTIFNIEDTDGDVNTKTDQVPKSWHLSLYRKSIDPVNLITESEATSIGVSVLSEGLYIACESDSGALWKRINGNKVLCDTFYVGTDAVSDTFVNFHQNVITIRTLSDIDGNIITSADRVSKIWYLELREGSPTGTVIASGNSTEITSLSLPPGIYYAVEADSAGWIHFGYTLRGIQTSSISNNVGITVTNGENVTIDFIKNAPPVYTQLFRTATAEDWATAYDYKGSLKSVKKKPDKVEFHFQITIPSTAYYVKMSFSGIVTVIDTCVWEPWNFLCSKFWSPNSKDVVIGTDGYNVGEKIPINGYCLGNKPVKVKLVWSTSTGILKENITQFDVNLPRLPKPDLHNVGEELFAGGAFPTGLLIGKPEGSKGAHSVLLKKYKDVQSSLNKKGQLHTGNPDSLAMLISGRFINKQQTSLPPDKQNNKLFAELLALKMNVAASMSEKFPAGLGQLTYDDPSNLSDLLNGLLVDSIIVKADSVISCRTVLIHGDTLELNAVYDVIRRIDSAFADIPNFKDTSSFSTSTMLTGVRALIEVPFLHLTPGIEPVIVKLLASEYTEIPALYKLHQNYPNPFNPTTTIQFDLPDQALVTLKIYNTLGQEVAVLFNNELMDEGTQEFEFDASGLSSGVYFYRITAQPVADDEGSIGEMFVSVKKMLLVK